MTEKEAYTRLCHIALDYDIHGDDIDAVNIAISALEKQILKKVVKEYDGYAVKEYNGCADGIPVWDTASCPNCNEFYEEGYDGWKCNYCRACGQKLDWCEKDD